MERFFNFLTAVLINMAFRSGFLLLAVITFILFLIVHIPLYITFIVLGVWVVYAILITLGITFVSRCNAVPRNQKGIQLHKGRNAYFDAMYRDKPKSSESSSSATETKSEHSNSDAQNKSGADHL